MFHFSDEEGSDNYLKTAKILDDILNNESKISG